MKTAAEIREELEVLRPKNGTGYSANPRVAQLQHKLEGELKMAEQREADQK